MVSTYKILLLGSHINYNLEHYVKMALEKLGHSVTFFGYREFISSPIRMAIARSSVIRNLAKLPLLDMVNKRIKNIALKIMPELVLSIKGEAILPSTIRWFKEQLGSVTALWYPDDPRWFNSLVKHIAPHYDYVFTASEKAVEHYKEIGVKNVFNLPFACEPSVHRRVQLTKEELDKYKCDICFVGGCRLRRAQIISKLKKFDVRVYGPYWNLLPIFGIKTDTGIWGHEMVKAFNAAKIVLNIHVESDLDYKPNMRTFEATGSGSFLLTDRAYGLEKLFEIGREVVCYSNVKELINLIEYYLDDDDERTKISTKGQNRAYREHTYEKRIKRILELVS
jgi:spore maturation protein CgeB